MPNWKRRCRPSSGSNLSPPGWTGLWRSAPMSRASFPATANWPSGFWMGSVSIGNRRPRPFASGQRPSGRPRTRRRSSAVCAWPGTVRWYWPCGGISPGARIWTRPWRPYRVWPTHSSARPITGSKHSSSRVTVYPGMPMAGPSRWWYSAWASLAAASSISPPMWISSFSFPKQGRPTVTGPWTMSSSLLAWGDH